MSGARRCNACKNGQVPDAIELRHNRVFCHYCKTELSEASKAAWRKQLEVQSKERS